MSEKVRFYLLVILLLLSIGLFLLVNASSQNLLISN